MILADKKVWIGKILHDASGNPLCIENAYCFYYDKDNSIDIIRSYITSAKVSSIKYSNMTTYLYTGMPFENINPKDLLFLNSIGSMGIDEIFNTYEKKIWYLKNYGGK